MFKGASLQTFKAGIELFTEQQNPVMLEGFDRGGDSSVCD